MKKPDTMEKGIRLGCGAALGVVLGASTAWYYTDLESVTPFVLTVVAFAVVFALLALVWGDRFWRVLSNLPLWYWWR